MTLPLQSMDKAPRDGSEVLLQCSAAYCSWGAVTSVSACWNGVDWDGHPEGAFIGWLDLPGMARDSARLQWLIDHNAAVCTAMKGMSSVVVNVGTTGEAWVSEYPSSDPRAAIDKEAERG